MAKKKMLDGVSKRGGASPRDIKEATITPAKKVGKEKFEKIILESAGLWADREEDSRRDVKDYRRKLWRKQTS